jgi:hypothetical protein
MTWTRTRNGTSTEKRPFEVRPSLAAMLESWTGYAILAAILTTMVIEALLAVRLWAELTSQDVASGLLRMVYSLTNGLVAPFIPHDASESVRATGIFEVATLTTQLSLLKLRSHAEPSSAPGNEGASTGAPFTALPAGWGCSSFAGITNTSYSLS